MINVLITAENSYIGNSFFNYINLNYNKQIRCSKISLRNKQWESFSFKDYDVIFHVAGLAHSDNGHISDEKAKMYYSINTNLTLEVAKKAIYDNAKHFIYMSSAIVYGESARIGENKNITKDSVPIPKNAYGDSKLKAEVELIRLYKINNDKRLTIIRSPMVYGDESKGNFRHLKKIALALPFFPYIKNERSVLNINSLCEFISDVVLNNDKTNSILIYFPQDNDYMNTSLMVKKIANDNNKELVLIPGLSGLFRLLSYAFPIINKVFGNFTYDKDLKYIKL